MEAPSISRVRGSVSPLKVRLFSPVETVWNACVLIIRCTYDGIAVLRVLRSQKSNTNGRLQLVANTLLLAAAVRDAQRVQWNRRVHHVLPDGNDNDSPRRSLHSQDGLDVFHEWLRQNYQKRKRARMRLCGYTEQALTR